MAEQPSEQVAQFVVSPIGGAIVWLALTPTGCADPGTLICPTGQEVNVLGLTMFGLVGTLDSAGLIILGFVIAVVLYFVVGALAKRP